MLFLYLVIRLSKKAFNNQLNMVLGLDSYLLNQHFI